jgi:hypothetical protein
MATTTIEITDPRQDKAKVIDELWQRLSQERKTWLQQGLEARRYVTAKSTDDTEVGTLPWKNKTTIPKLTQIKDNLQSFYMAALMPSDDWFRFEGSDKASHEKAELIEAYMGTKIKMSGFRRTLEQIVDDWITYGNAFAGVEWEHSVAKSRVTGEEMPLYIGPKLVRISPLDCAIDPRAPSFDKSPFIRRRYMTLSEFVTYNDKDPAVPFDASAVRATLDLRRGERADWTEYYKNRGLEVDGFQSWGDYFESQYIEILEFYGDLFVQSTGEIITNHCIKVAERAFVLSDAPIQAWSGRKPIAHVGWRVLPDNLYGQGPLDNLVGMQYRCDHLENLKADTFDQVVHPIIKIKGDEVEDFEWGPGVKVWTGIDGDVEVIRPDSSILNVNTEIATYHNLMEQMAGSPREMMGFRSPGEKTAFEVNVLQQGADRVFQNRLNRFEDMIESVLNLMYEMIIQNLDVVDVARVFNDDTKALTLATITRENVLADGTIRPVGAKHFAARNKRLQEMRTLLELGANQLIQPHFSGLRAGVAMQEELGFEKYGIIEKGAGVLEQLETQMMVEQLSQQQAPMGQEMGDGSEELE